MIYQPKEDSYFLAEQVSKYLKNSKMNSKKIKILDLGTGSGIQAETCSKLGFSNITVSDIDSEALKKLENKFKTQKSDLFKRIEGKFDLIIFNPPYLPEHKYDKEKDTTGGKKGDETILRFLNQAIRYLNKDGKILLLLSSYTPRTKIKKIIKQKYIIEKISEKKLFFETLQILLLSESRSD